MVSSVQPATTFIPPTSVAKTIAQLGANDSGAPAPRGDTVAFTGTDINGARLAIAGASTALDVGLAAGREAAGVLSQMRDLARAAVNGGAGPSAGIGDAQFKALLQRYSQIIDNAIAGGADILSGKALTLQVDPDTPPVTVQGYDMRLKNEPGTEDVLRLSTSSSLADDGSAISAARDADASLARLDTALSRLSGASQKLAAHDGFLATLDGATAKLVDPEINGESARLIALQVRQTLAGANAAIANSGPGSLLSLFVE
jgi:flagellin